MDFFIVIRTVHSLVRWIIVLIAILSAIKFALAWRKQANVQPTDRALMSTFSGMVDFQVLLGLILILGQGFTTPIGFPINRIEHMITMLVAAFIAHAPMAWRKNDAAIALRNNLFVIIAVIVLIILGVASLGGNRWF